VYTIQNINYYKKEEWYCQEEEQELEQVGLRGKANLEKKPNQCVFLLAKLIVL
jgi:hypothetical protein